MTEILNDVFDEYFAPDLTDEQVFNEIVEDFSAKAIAWSGNPDKLEFAIELSALENELASALMLSKSPAKAAYITFKLAALISQVSGSSELGEMLQRQDAMRVEINDIAAEFEEKGLKPTAALLWRELMKRCEQHGSCCVSVENDSKNDKQVIVWRRTGGGVGRMDLASLRQRLKKMVR